MLTDRLVPVSLPKNSLWLPAEWETHEATWLAWPKNRTTWPGKLLKEVESIYLQMITALLPGECVNLLVTDDVVGKKVLKYLPSTAKLQNLKFHKLNYVDSWIRDYGPIFIKAEGPSTSLGINSRRKAGGKAFTKWRFNAWGNKYADLAKDNGVVNRISALKKYKRLDAGIVLEGGSIDVNGTGTCLTTEQCLLNPNRNPKLSKEEIEEYLKHFLGIKKVIWLKRGIAGDDTDGHIDDIARFVDAGRIVTVTEADASDKNHAVLKENLDILKAETDQQGKHFEIWQLPMPGKVGSQLPASYANFYIANRVVLVPTYNHQNDRVALEVIQKAFPKRKVVGIECSALVHGLGSIHCVTQQEPR